MKDGLNKKELAWTNLHIKYTNHILRKIIKTLYNKKFKQF